MIACRYFDGTSSRARPATIALDGSTVRVLGDDLDRVIEPERLTFVPATDRGPARLVLDDGSLCEIDDRAAAAALFEQLGHRPAATDRLVSNTWRVVAVVVAFVAVMAGLYRWGIPWATDRLVERAPRSWDAALGEQLLATLDERRVLRPSKLPQSVRDRVLRRFAALRPLPDAPQVRILFRDFLAPNALALPGGIIVVTDEIVSLASGDDDALATVLAHEVGHVAHRDALRQLARSSVTSALAAWYFGDVSSTAAVAAGGIGAMKYSREAEHEADLYAIAMMRANGVSTRSAADLFRRLEAWEPPPPLPKRSQFRVSEYLSTHPNTDDRILLFEGGADPSSPPRKP